jgi:selenocysteine lyase/cysteine desulfurase
MRVARRDFLKFAGIASLAGGFSGRIDPAAATEAGTFEFGFSDDSVPMNAANLCPMPVVVSEAQARYAKRLDRSLSTASRNSIENLKEEARSRIAALLGASADEIAIVRNTSEANNVIVQGVPLAADDEVALWDQNHPSNGVAWDVQAARLGATVRRFAVPLTSGSVDEVVDIFVDAVTGKTRVLSFTHISNVTGFRLPAAEICAAVRARHPDVHIHIDGAQTWGAVDIDLEATGCDSFSASAHKWFMGPREVGLLYVRAHRIEAIWPNIVSVPWGNTMADAPRGARKFDALGQRDDAAIAALVDTAALHEALTPAGVEQRSTMIATMLRDGLADLGVRFVSSNNPVFTSSVIILAASDENAPRLVDLVFKYSGVQTAAVGGFRMSPHIYNTEDHANRVIAALAKNRLMLA